MNERIRELSKEAWAWAEQQEYTDPAKEFSDILEQKFAELIITKCAVVASRCEANGTKNVGAEILEHFGVE